VKAHSLTFKGQRSFELCEHKVQDPQAGSDSGTLALGEPAKGHFWRANISFGDGFDILLACIVTLHVSQWPLNHDKKGN
jgi:hypothetical protein